MAEPTQSGKKKPPRQAKEPKEDHIQTPIDIARARHVSTYGPSIIDKTQSTPAGPTDQPNPPAKSKAAKPAAGDYFRFFNSSNGCIIIAMVGVAFIVGGFLGGMIGGGMLLWVNNTGGLAALTSPPTATTFPTPTAVPVATITPTPTPEPVATLMMEDIIAAVIPSVVTVINQQEANLSARSTFDEGRVVGSGVIIDVRGYIATNNHVVDRPGDLKVLLADGREAVAELVAANPAEDLALLKIDLTSIQPIIWGDSARTRPGQMVYAIGSPLGDFPNSVSFGIVSGLNRALEIDKFVIDGLIQTDAAINRGSSGGPLINLDGQVIGINTFIIRESEERGVAEGIAFSIPADTAKSFLIPWIAAHTGESVPIPAAEEGK